MVPNAMVVEEGGWGVTGGKQGVAVAVSAAGRVLLTTLGETSAEERLLEEREGVDSQMDGEAAMVGTRSV